MHTCRHGTRETAALILDFDGTIVDTESPELNSLERLFDHFGVQFPVDRWLNTVGTELTFDPFAYLESQVEEELDLPGLRELAHQRHRELVLAAGLRPGIREYLQRAQEIPLKLGVASSAKAEWVVPLLQHYGILTCFDVIVTADDVRAVKPHPDLYLRAIQELGSEGRRTIAIEDSVNGLIAAVSAGLRCVVVPNEVTKRLRWPDEPRGHFVATLSTVTLDELLLQLNAE